MLLKRNDVLPSSSGGQGGQGQGRFKIDPQTPRPRAICGGVLGGGLNGWVGWTDEIRASMRDQNRIGDENDETGSDGDATPRGVRERDRGDVRRRRVFRRKSTGKCPFIAMQLVGENLADLKRDVESSSSSSHHRQSENNTNTTTKRGNTHLFTEITIALIYAQTIDALGQHACKRLRAQRRVKPGNICIGRGSRAERAKTYLIDFGLARRYKDETTDKVIAEREDA